jgi:hypothetical protein
MAGLLGVACAAIPAGAQTQTPEQGPAAPKFALTVAVADGDEKFGKAVEQAKEYFAAVAKGDEKDKDKVQAEKDNAEKGRPPSFPAAAEDGKAAATAVDLVAAAAALPPLGLGEKLVAEQLTAAKAAAARNRWVRLTDANALVRLGLDASAQASETRKDYYNGAAAARKAKDVYVHPAVKWAIYSRESQAQAVEYFVLVLQPEDKSLVTQADVLDITPESPGVVVRLTPGGGTERLKAFTTEYQSKPPGTLRCALVTFGDNAEEVMVISETIANGRLRLGVERDRAASAALARQLANARR